MNDPVTPGRGRPGVVSAGARRGFDARRVHKVGIGAVLLAALSFVLPFATVSQSRIATGAPLAAWDLLGAAGLAGLLVPWALIALASVLRAESRAAAAIRGVAAALAIVWWLAVSGAVAGPAIADAGTFARYSLGAGVWVSAFAALALVVASRRELGVSTPAGWAASLLAPAGLAALVVSGRLEDLGMLVEYRNLGDSFWPSVGQHVAYSAVSIAIATVLGIGLGVLAFRNRRAARPIFAVVSGFQTIPGLALIGILVVPMASLSNAFPVLREFGIGGLGWAPVVLALTLYALLAVVRNTYAGLESVPAETVDAGRGMGMTSSQLVRRVQMPLAVPIVFSGVRTASQQTVGNATLGAFVAAGGLGPLVFLGLAQQANDLVLLGSVALVLLALAVDGIMRAAQRAVTPRRSRKDAR